MGRQNRTRFRGAAAGLLALLGASCAIDPIVSVSSDCESAGAESESCNGLDEDCDGRVDEGVLPQMDVNNCGACGNTCSAGARSSAVCNRGVCELVCDPGRGDCDGDTSNGCEVSLRDSAHCGDCVTSCAAPTPVCSSGMSGRECAADCGGGEELCGDTCTVVSSDPDHCGGCGRPCPVAEGSVPICTDGSCSFGCAEGFLDCRSDGAGCVPQDTANCGGCGAVCVSLNGTTACKDGVCAPICDEDYDSCGGDPSNGCETYLPSDLAHCGSCDNDCAVNEACDESTCVDDRSISVCSGQEYSCSLGLSGRIHCWGRNQEGTLGEGTTTDRSMAVRAVLGPASQLSCGKFHACAVVAGQVFCWGRGNEGQIGDGGTTSRSTPVKVLGIDTAEHVAAGAVHTCALLSDATVRCWGNNEQGQLGNDATTDVEPVPVVTDLSMVDSPVLELQVGNRFSCVRSTASARVWCWGSDEFGRLGNGIGEDALIPTRSLTGYSGLSLADSHVCARWPVGELRCWGRGTYGQLGNGEFADQQLPVDVDLPMPIVAHRTGERVTCAIALDGRIMCWGSNRGLVVQPDGSGTNVPTPTFRPADSPVGPAVEVAPGYEHVCALNSVGEVWCWGEGSKGRLGNGDTRDSANAVRVLFSAP